MLLQRWPGHSCSASCVTTVLALIAMSVVSGSIVAQESCDRIPPREAPPKELVEAMKRQYEQDSVGFQLPDKKMLKAVRNDRQQLRRAMVDRLEDRMFIHGTPINALLDSMMDVIVATDPSLTRPRVNLTWLTIPNAVSWGEGTITVFIGLLPHLRSKDELAFVLAHELAHHHQGHTDRDIRAKHERLASGELKEQVKEAMRQTYGRRARLEALLMDVVVDVRKHGRAYESESDSLGLIWLMRTRFDPLGAIGTMEVLDKTDKELDQRPIDLRAAFDHPGVDFSGLMARSQTPISSLAGVDAFDRSREEDLKTHPDCVHRAEDLRIWSGMEGMGEGGPTNEARAAYAGIARKAMRWLVESEFYYEDAGRAVFLALQRLRDEPEDPFWNAAVARGFAMLHKASKEHDLAFVLATPKKTLDPVYATFLEVVHGLRMSEYAALSEHYLQRARSSGPACEATLFATFWQAHAKGVTNERGVAHDALFAAYPDTRYRELVEELVAPPVKPKR
ncbi:MAG TPA: M48 family metalloprotease [Flavobacteriales bacterium]|jgi:hypothetical protein|nr:M48 family metalloprotease [Flavobacteriales bacterium]